MRLTGETHGGATLALTANRLDLDALDPQGLTLAQALATPRAASAGALAFAAGRRHRRCRAATFQRAPARLREFHWRHAGVVGALRRDQRDRVLGRDLFAEGRWRFLPRWQATLGVRRSRVGFRSQDHYVAQGNPDDGGSLDYAFTTPAAGLLFRPSTGVELCASAGRGFETPSSSELAYRPDGASGFNTALRPARSESFEAGMRLHRDGRDLQFAAFDSRTRDELVVASSSGGRSTYANAANTRRRGLELSASGELADRWQYSFAATALDARFVDTGKRIPAIAARTAWAELRWKPRDALELFLAGNAGSRLHADDANLAWAPGYATFDLGAERRWQFGKFGLRAFARIDNLFDRARSAR